MRLNGYEMPYEEITGRLTLKPEEKPAEFEHPIENRMVISMDLDGKRLMKDIDERVRKEVVDEIKKEVKKTIFEERNYYYGTTPTKRELNPWIVEEIKTVIHEYKDEIIQQAAKELADSMRRSKPVRERFCDILEEEVENG